MAVNLGPMDGDGDDQNTVAFHVYSADGAFGGDAAAEVRRFCEEALGKWLFHCDVFRIDRGPGELDDGTIHFSGNLQYGSNVEDEWQLVHVFRELSLVFPDAVVQCQDSHDGEFLLVEAADFLPAWLMSEAEGHGRVFLSRGRLRILPAERDPGDRAEAVRWALSGGESTEMESDVHACIDRRLSALRTRNTDTFNAVLPRRHAQMLYLDPKLLSLVVHELSRSDPLELDTARREYLARDLDPVRCSVEATRVQRAEILSWRRLLIDGTDSSAGSESDTTESEFGTLVSVALTLATRRYQATDPSVAGDSPTPHEQTARTPEKRLHEVYEGVQRALDASGRLGEPLPYHAAIEDAARDSDPIEPSPAPEDSTAQYELGMAMRSMEAFLNDLAHADGVDPDGPLDVDDDAVLRAVADAVGGLDVEDELARSFRSRTRLDSVPDGDSVSSEDDSQPLEIDEEMVRNLLASIEAQHGEPGPAGNLFGALGYDSTALSQAVNDGGDRRERGGPQSSRKNAPR